MAATTDQHAAAFVKTTAVLRPARRIYRTRSARARGLRCSAEQVARSHLLERSASHRTRHIAVALDAVHNVRNLASACRSCDAFGVQQLHIVPKETPDLDRERSMAQFRNNWASTAFRDLSDGTEGYLSTRLHETPADCVKALHDAGYRVLVSSLHEQAVDLHDVSVERPFALVFGNELNGVSEDMVALADGFFKIPMNGLVESFNIGAALAITLFKLVGRTTDAIPAERFYLPKDEQRELLQAWSALPTAAPPMPEPKRKGWTSLSPSSESQILRYGVFAGANGGDAGEKLGDILRLKPDTGVNLSRSLHRAKFGCVFNRRIEKSRESLKRAVAGSASLLAVRATSLSVEVLKRSFDAVIDHVIDYYKSLDEGVRMQRETAMLFEAALRGLNAVRQPDLCTLSGSRDFFADLDDAVLSLLRRASATDLVCIVGASVSRPVSKVLSMLSPESPAFDLSESQAARAIVSVVSKQLHADDEDLQVPLLREVMGLPVETARASGVFESSHLQVLNLLLRLHHTANITCTVMSIRNPHNFELSDERKILITSPRMSPYECMMAQAFHDTTPKFESNVRSFALVLDHLAADLCNMRAMARAAQAHREGDCA